MRTAKGIAGMGFSCALALMLGACERSPDGVPAQGLTEDEFQVMWSWLACEECTNGELDSVLNMTNSGRTVEFFSKYLHDSSSIVFRSVREDVRGTLLTVQDPPSSQSDYVDRFMANFWATVRTRSMAALSGMGEWDILRMARDSADAWGFRDDERSALDQASFNGTVSGTVPVLGPAQIYVATDASLATVPPPPAVFRCRAAPPPDSPPARGSCFTYSGGAVQVGAMVDNGFERIYTVGNLQEGVYEVRSNLDGLDSTVLVLLLAPADTIKVTFQY